MDTTLSSRVPGTVVPLCGASNDQLWIYYFGRQVPLPLQECAVCVSCVNDLLLCGAKECNMMFTSILNDRLTTYLCQLK